MKSILIKQMWMLVTLAALNVVLNAQTPIDIPICTAPGYKSHPRAVPDGNGGAIVIWNNNLEGNSLYAQRIDSIGLSKWENNGVPVFNSKFGWTCYSLISNGAGGSFIANWYNILYTSEYPLRIQRVNTSGKRLWGDDGLLIHTDEMWGYSYNIPAIVKDKEGDVVLAWSHTPAGFYPVVITVQRIGLHGYRTNVATNGHAITPILTRDKSGSVIIGYVYGVNKTDWYVRAQKIDAFGSTVWLPEGVTVGTTDNRYTSPLFGMISNGAYGTIITWSTRDSLGSSLIKAQLLDSNGTKLWEPDGIIISNNIRYATRPFIVYDDNNGAIIAWSSEGFIDNKYVPIVSAQRIDSSGNILWAPNGVIISSGSEYRRLSEFIPDGSGGAILIWVEWTYGPYDANHHLYAQRLDPQGNKLWGINGILISDDIGEDCCRENCCIVNNKPGNYTIIWRNKNGDIYGKIIDSLGNTVGVSYISMPIPFTAGWNLMSVPVDPIAKELNNLFPQASSSAFSYNGSYVASSKVEKSLGYWLKFPDNYEINVIGVDQQYDTVIVQSGWNIIGSTSVPIDISTVETIPETLLSTPFYLYDSTYKTASTIHPGKGYWVKAKQAGIIILSAESLTKSIYCQPVNERSAFNQFIFKDASGRNQTLYIAEMSDLKFPIDYYELPPSPPEDQFVVSFKTQKNVEFYKEKLVIPQFYDITVKNASYPIQISYNLRRRESSKQISLIQLSNEKELSCIKLGGEGILKIKNAAVNVIRISITENNQKIPTQFALIQNYPNPFNPTTIIAFDVPKKSNVSLIVYDILGKEVMRLVEGEYEPGSHTIEADLSSLASGVYLYRLSASSYVSVKKMVLTK
ncbi:MAG: T9SS type A sorting domain-containing protein [Bacteroidota bacterium]|nr:T9SS type A sorting domain-containing protein [Bacteroidota bacterium]